MTTHTKPGATLLALTGALDGECALAQRERFTALAVAGRDVVLDMTDVSSIDGAGIGALAYLFRRLTAEGANLRIRGVSGKARLHLLKLGLAPVFSVPVRRRRRAPTARLVAA